MFLLGVVCFIFYSYFFIVLFFLFLLAVGVPERSNGLERRTSRFSWPSLGPSGLGLRRFESCPPHHSYSCMVGFSFISIKKYPMTVTGSKKSNTDFCSIVCPIDVKIIAKTIPIIIAPMMFGYSFRFILLVPSLFFKCFCTLFNISISTNGKEY